MNTAKLRGIIAERGFSQREVAKQIGISEKTFYSKMKNGVFGTDEADRMIELLKIEDPATIFLSVR
jgi:DNA-binding XRE family transcriptional regulator|nr:MAG TPA: SOS-response transcriptional repressor [Caudoviricetes sp.]